VGVCVGGVCGGCCCVFGVFVGLLWVVVFLCGFVWGGGFLCCGGGFVLWLLVFWGGCLVVGLVVFCGVLCGGVVCGVCWGVGVLCGAFSSWRWSMYGAFRCGGGAPCVLDGVGWGGWWGVWGLGGCLGIDLGVGEVTGWGGLGFTCVGVDVSVGVLGCEVLWSGRSGVCVWVVYGGLSSALWMGCCFVLLVVDFSF
jgi:hypothetical protein